MKKWITAILLIVMLGTPALAFEVIIPVVLYVFRDEIIKFTSETECWKGGCQTVYRPAPGYTNNDQYWNANDLAAHYRDYRDQYSFDASNPPINAVARLNPNPDRYSNVAGIAASSAAVPFPLESNKTKLRKGDIYFSRSDTTGAAIG